MSTWTHFDLAPRAPDAGAMELNATMKGTSPTCVCRGDDVIRSPRPVRLDSLDPRRHGRRGGVLHEQVCTACLLRRDPRRRQARRGKAPKGWFRVLALTSGAPVPGVASDGDLPVEIALRGNWRSHRIDST